MTIINALETLKEKGVTCMVGMYNVTDIDDYIAHAHKRHDISVQHSDVPCHQYSLDHEDDHFLVEYDGHYIIGTWYESGNGTPFCMATHSDYEAEEEMRTAFNEWEIAKDAAEITEKMETERPGELPRVAWVAIATAELKATHVAAKAAFKRDFPQDGTI